MICTPCLPTSPSISTTRIGCKTPQENPPTTKTWAPTYHAQSYYRTWKDSPYNDKPESSYYDSPPRSPIHIISHQTHGTQGHITHATTLNGHLIVATPYDPYRRPPNLCFLPHLTQRRGTITDTIMMAPLLSFTNYMPMKPPQKKLGGRLV